MFGFIKKIVLWSYERGSWQYDLLCVCILAFIFLTPGWVFDERLRANNSQQTASAFAERTYILASDLATANVSNNLRDLLAQVVSQKFKQEVIVKRFEVDSDSEGTIRGYRVWFERKK